MSDILRLLAVLALVLGNAFFVIGEYAVVTARRAGISARAEAGSAGARAALRLMDEPVRVISTVQVGITAIGILTGALGEPAIRDVLGEGIPSWLAFVIAFSLITYVTVVLGELVPKALTLDRAETLAILVARPVEWISIALRPAVWVLERSAQFLLLPFGVREVIAGEGIRSAAELRALVDEAEGSGVIHRAQEELLHNVFDFATREARDVMVPAPDVSWLDASTEAQAALSAVAEMHHTRYPVGRGSIDRIIGVVHVQEIVRAARQQPLQSIESIAADPLVIPPTKDLGALLRQMRETRQQLAIVGDEYGGTSGIVTVEDIVEEIVGEIEDEYDLPNDTLVHVDESTVQVAGSMTIDDFNEMLGTDFSRTAARTMAGLVFTALGHRPSPGESVTIDHARLTVNEVEGARITRITVRYAERPGPHH